LNVKDLVRQFARSTSERELLAATTEAQHRLTPGEFVKLAEQFQDFAPAARRWVQGLLPVVRQAAPYIRPFKRETLLPDITRYSSRTGVRSRKTLILVFSGLQGGPMVPVPVLLQLLPEDACDLVLLRDTSRTLFVNGLPPVATSLFDLVSLCSKLLSPSDYRRLICYGGSGGGFPALRAALLMGASRGVSVSGRLSWNIRRLLDGSGRSAPSFDPLCDCFRDAATEIVCAYGADNAVDVEDARRIAAILPVRLRPVPGIAVHNFLWELARAGKAQDFINQAFDFSVPPYVEQLAASVVFGGLIDARTGVAKPPGRRGAPKKLT
jgi:hypothetical protein